MPGVAIATRPGGEKRPPILAESLAPDTHVRLGSGKPPHLTLISGGQEEQVERGCWSADCFPAFMSRRGMGSFRPSRDGYIAIMVQSVTVMLIDDIDQSQ